MEFRPGPRRLINSCRCFAKKRLLQYGGGADGTGQAGHDDLRALGMAEPSQEWNRLRGGTNPRRRSERGSPFVGVTVAYLNRSSPNQDLTTEFLERYALTEKGLAMYHASRPAFQH